MHTFFTSDLHLGHANIIRYCDRPFRTVDDMDDGLAAAWAGCVGVDDVVWVLGDVALGDVDAGLARVAALPGVKHLVVGNHDRPFRRTGAPRPEWDLRYEAAGFTVHHGSVTLPARDVGLDVAGDVRLCHFPYEGDSRGADRHQRHRPRDDGVPLLHGHVHGRGRPRVPASGTVQIDVGVDAWDYRPVPAETLTALLASQ